MRPALALLAVLTASFAGCVTPDDDGSPGGPHAGPGGTMDARLLAGTYVDWDLSDYWEYDLFVRGLDRYNSTRLVYYDHAGDEYTIGTPHYDEALHHAVFSFNPILGRVHERILSPHDGGEHAFMFPFHRTDTIVDGDEWTTHFYGRSVTMRAAYADNVPAPDGPTRGFRITATDPNDPQFQVAYSYVRDAKWFTYLTVTDAQGTWVDLRLTEHGTGATGPGHFIRAKDYLHETLHATGTSPASAAFDVSDADVTNRRVESFAISAGIHMQSGVGATLRLLDPSGRSIWQGQFAADQDQEHNIQEIWPSGTKSHAPIETRPQWSAGTYTVELAVTGQGMAEVRIVGTQDNSGSV